VTRPAPVLAASILALLAAPAVAPAANVACGQTITTDTTLDGDVANCPGDGIVIGADNITLNLGGHVVDRMGPTDIGAGILNYNPATGRGYDGVTIKNGRIQQFNIGVRVVGAARTSISSLSVQASDTAIVLAGVQDSLVESNSLRGTILGIHLGAGTRGTRVVRNSVFDSIAGIYSAGSSEGSPAGANLILKNALGYNGTGILIDTGTDDTAVEGNTVHDTNGGDGIEIRQPGPTPNRVGANTSTLNDGLGIRAAAPVTDLGGNQARDNREPAQCVGVSCDKANITLFGKPYSGVSFSSMSAEAKRASAFTFLVSGTVTKLTAFIDGKGATTGSQVIRAVLYANKPGGGPGALVARSFQGTVVAGEPARWVRFCPPPPPRLQQGVYWLGLHSGQGNGVARFAWDPAPSSRYYNIDAFADGSANPFGPAPVDNQQMSIFASGLYLSAPSS
jgi:hypothetical protein